MPMQKLAWTMILMAALAAAAMARGAAARGFRTGGRTDMYTRMEFASTTTTPFQRRGKPVMVMAHGSTDYGLNWTTLTLELQGSYDIYMVDARGPRLHGPAHRGYGGQFRRGGPWPASCGP